MQTKVFMTKFRSKLTRMEKQLNGACGDHGELQKYFNMRMELEVMVEDELRRLVEDRKEDWWRVEV